MHRNITHYISTGIFSMALLLPLNIAYASSYGKQICNSNGYKCYQVKRGQTWAELFPNDRQRDLVKRINRTNQRLRTGQVIAVPTNFGGASLMGYAPFNQKIEGTGSKTIIVNLKALAWGAYDESGRLVRWGPASGGKSYCPDVRRACRTAVGSFAVYRKQGAGCKSTKYPIGKGGAPMPYCMFFRGGYALHGSPQVPGYNASHGCVRLFTEDARWLNKSFVTLGNPTRVIVKPY